MIDLGPQNATDTGLVSMKKNHTLIIMVSKGDNIRPGLFIYSLDFTGVTLNAFFLQ